jgi:hypothetical protein
LSRRKTCAKLGPVNPVFLPILYQKCSENRVLIWLKTTTFGQEKCGLSNITITQKIFSQKASGSIIPRRHRIKNVTAGAKRNLKLVLKALRYGFFSISS